MIKKIISLFKSKDPNMQIKWSLYGRVWLEVGKPYWLLLLSGVAFTFLAAGAEGYSISLIKKVIDQGFIEKNMDMLIIFGIEIIGSYAVKGACTYLRSLTMTKAGLLGVSHLRRRIYKHMMNQEISYFYDSHTGQLMNYFTSFPNSVLSLVTDNVISIAHNVATIIIMLSLMIWFSPQMSAVLLILIPGIIIPILIITRKRNILVRTGFGVEADSMTHITQSLEGIKTIKSFNTEEFESERMNKIEDGRVSVNFKATKLSAMESPILEMIISFGLCGALLVGGYFISIGDLTTGDFTAFLLALTAAYKPVKTLTSVNGGIQAGLIAAESLFAFLDKKPIISNANKAINLTKQSMNVRFDNVNFFYKNLEDKALNDLTLNVKSGEVCAFVGPSGGGKSTILNLLCRFYEAQKGSIYINDININDISLKSLRQNIATVSQDIFLFKGTIAENIKYGCPDATEAEIEIAAKMANAHDFIMEFPDQYQNYVGERGTMLSGGQKQRIAIARAILKDAPILLLDEATSALDSHSEKHIQTALKNLMKNRTTFVIAHRLSTILDADKICVIKNGQIIEQGTDEELVQLDGEYKKLKDVQFNDVK